MDGWVLIGTVNYVTLLKNNSDKPHTLHIIPVEKTNLINTSDSAF